MVLRRFRVSFFGSLQNHIFYTRIGSLAAFCGTQNGAKRRQISAQNVTSCILRADAEAGNWELTAPGTGSRQLTAPGAGAGELTAPGTGSRQLTAPGAGSRQLTAPGAGTGELNAVGSRELRKSALGVLL